MNSGILLIDKPSGITSHDVVDQLRQSFAHKKIGHAGTLDPLATGLMVVLVGKEATRLSDHFRGKDKTYIINFDIGYVTDTLDSDGKITQQKDSMDPSIHIPYDTFKEALHEFPETYDQEVPLFSAVKVQGHKLYSLARNQSPLLNEIEIPKRTVNIWDKKLLDYNVEYLNAYPYGMIEATMSAGTYTRAFLRDLGLRLQVPMTQTGLRRTTSGSFSVDDALPLYAVTEDDIIPVKEIEAAIV